MKKSAWICLIFLPALTIAQFPAPQDFQITVNYIHLGASDWCDGQWVQGPTYCYLFSWEAPDTTNTPASLTGYRIYKDSVLFLSTTLTQADSTGGYIASFYVTAIYADPSGESEPSNTVVIPDLPVPTEEAVNTLPIEIRFDQARRVLFINGAIDAFGLQVYDMQGKQVFNLNAAPAYLDFGALAPGIYWVVVRGKEGFFVSKKIVLWN